MYVQPPKYRYMAIATIQENIREILMQQTGSWFRHNTYMYILYLRYEDTVLEILYVGLPTTIADDWLNSLTTSNVLCTANGQMIIYVGTDVICTYVPYANYLIGSKIMRVLNHSKTYIHIHVWLQVVSYE